jgi:hypothetical protein
MNAWQKLDQYIQEYEKEDQGWDDFYVLHAVELIKRFDVSDWETCKQTWQQRNDVWLRDATVVSPVLRCL